jgi:hypothetical protein
MWLYQVLGRELRVYRRLLMRRVFQRDLNRHRWKRQPEGDQDCSEVANGGDKRRFSLPEALVSMVLFGGVGRFLFRPAGQVRKCRPASGFFASRQTFMPEFDQPPFYIDRSKRRR